MTVIAYDPWSNWPTLSGFRYQSTQFGYQPLVSYYNSKKYQRVWNPESSTLIKMFLKKKSNVTALVGFYKKTSKKQVKKRKLKNSNTIWIFLTRKTSKNSPIIALYIIFLQRKYLLESADVSSLVFYILYGQKFFWWHQNSSKIQELRTKSSTMKLGTGN